MRPPRRGLLGNLALAAAATLLSVLAAELALRVLAARRPPLPVEDLAQFDGREAPPYRGDCSPSRPSAVLADVIRPSPVPDLVYELEPGVDTCYYGARVRTNAAGLRADRDYARPKPQGVHRLLLLGDSQTFGQGVPLEQTFGELVAAELARRSGRAVEAINLGVDGYNTVQEAAALRAKGLSYEPDCVALLFIGNDLQLPAFLLRPVSPVTSRRSLLLAGLRGLWRQLTGRRLDAFEPLVARDPHEVPERYRHMVGMEAYRRALESISGALRPAGVPLVHFTNYSRTPHGRWRELVRWQRRELGFVVPPFRLPAGADVEISRENPHLNAEGHRRLADLVLAAFDESGVCLPQPAPVPAATATP